MMPDECSFFCSKAGEKHCSMFIAVPWKSPQATVPLGRQNDRVPVPGNMQFAMGCSPSLVLEKWAQQEIQAVTCNRSAASSDVFHFPTAAWEHESLWGKKYNWLAKAQILQVSLIVTQGSLDILALVKIVKCVKGKELQERKKQPTS